MIFPTQIHLPRNTVTEYDAQLQQALVGWMRTAGFAINELASSAGSGGGSVLSALVTVVVPSPARLEHVEVVTFTGCTGSARVFVSLAPHLDADENGPEGLSIQAMSATPGTDVALVTLAFGEKTSGPIKLNLMAV